MERIKNLLRLHLIALRRINSFIYTPVTKKILIVLVPSSIIITQLPFVASYIYGQAINSLANQKSIFGSTFWIGAVAITVWSIIAKTVRFIGMRNQSLFKKDVSARTELCYWKAYAHLDLQDRENPEVQSAVSDAQRNYTSVMEAFNSQWNIVGAVITIITSITILSIIQWWYMFVIIAMAVPSLYFTRMRKSKNYKQQKRLNELKRYSSELISNLGNKETIINGTTDYFLSLYQSIRSKLIAMDFKISFKFQNITFGADIWTFALYGILYYDVFTQVHLGLIQVGATFMVFNAITQLQDNLSALFANFVDMEDELTRVNDFFLILDMKPTINEIDGSIIVDQEKIPLIEFDDVWFKYPDTENYILKGVTFTIQPGERVGLVGENGEGKTTISLLMLRLYDPDKGTIRINGTDLREISRKSLFSITGVVFQDFRLFLTRCKENIRSYAVDKYNFDDIVSAAKKAGIHDFIESLPEKYDHKIGRIYKGGIKPSGGQRQKFAIASVLHRDSKLIILDELTSALSPTAENIVVRHYAEISKGKTCLVICQRYKSLEFVDRIMVLQNGTIAENGTHRELMSTNGLYTELFSLAQLNVV